MQTLSPNGVPRRNDPGKGARPNAIDRPVKFVSSVDAVTQPGGVSLPSARFTDRFKITMTYGEWLAAHERTYGATA